MTTAAADIETHRNYLYRYALLHVRDADHTKEVVQETLLAAIESAGGYAGRSSVKTWLTGILKHKITDLFRKQARETPVPETPDGGDDQEFADHFFDQARRDHWTSPPAAWADPEQSLERKRFWEVFESCAARMPPQVARVFAMRELMGMETADICKELDISPTNCWVILYRARMSLRASEGLRGVPQLPETDVIFARLRAQASDDRGWRGQVAPLSCLHPNARPPRTSPKRHAATAASRQTRQSHSKENGPWKAE